MRQLAAVIVLCVAALVPVSTVTDIWDVDGDDTASTDNELVHGASQNHDLQATGGVADQDWYRLGQKGYSSYEIVVDGLSEQVANVPPINANDSLQLHLVNSAGTLLSNSTSVSAHGSARSLRVRNTAEADDITEYVRVMAAVNGCGTACTAAAVYHITMRETTLFAPRFNNSGSQLTVLLLQNASNLSITYTARFFDSAGQSLAGFMSFLSPRGGAVINTAGITGLAGLSGVISIDHLGPYGSVTGKAVALEPATGFSFDTPLVSKPDQAPDSNSCIVPSAHERATRPRMSLVAQVRASRETGGVRSASARRCEPSGRTAASA